MPVKKVYGDAAPAPGDYQIPSLPTTKAASPPLEISRYARNSKHPDASFMNQMNDQMNQAMLFRTKEAFSMMGDLGSAPGIQATSTVGTRNRWRFAFHTSPYTHALLARVVMFPPSSNYGNDTYATLKIYSDTTETTLVSTTEFHFGAGPTNSSVGGWQYHRIIDKFIEGLTADTAYYGLWSDQTYGRLQSASIADLQSMTENYDGYLPNNFTEQSEILDIYRQNLVEPIPSLWKRGGAKVLGWTTNIQSFPSTNATNTLKNVLDSTSTTVTAATPGWTLDMRYKNRLSQTTVPCVMKVCAYRNGGDPAGGDISLKDSGGSVIASITSGWSTTTPTWVSATVNMPALLDKVDVQFSNGGAGTLNVCAIAIYEYET